MGKKSADEEFNEFFDGMSSDVDKIAQGLKDERKWNDKKKRQHELLNKELRRARK